MGLSSALEKDRRRTAKGCHGLTEFADTLFPVSCRGLFCLVWLDSLRVPSAYVLATAFLFGREAVEETLSGLQMKTPEKVADTLQTTSTGANLNDIIQLVERETGFEPATSTLARLHSTTELFPRGSGYTIPPASLSTPNCGGVWFACARVAKQDLHPSLTDFSLHWLSAVSRSMFG